MKKLFQLGVIVMLLLCSVGSIYAAPPLSIIQRIKDQVESIRYQLPQEIAPGLILTQVSYDSQKYTVVYRYHTTISVPTPTPEQIKELKLSVIHMLKGNPNSEDTQMVENGISLHYNYYSPDGAFMYAIKVTPADLK